MYIKGIGNTVPDAGNRLDYNPALNRHADDKDEKLSEETKWNNFLTLINCYDTKSNNEMNTDYKYKYSQVFANNLSNDEIYPLNVAEIADAQRSVPKWKSFFKKEDPEGNIRTVIIDKTEVLVKHKLRLVIPKVLQVRALQLQWYHHYL